MARIRTIKPEVWGDEKLAPLDPIHRLVFLALISLADDAGRLLDNVKQLDGLIFPETPHSCAESLDQLAWIEVIERGRTASGQSIIQIVGWKKHQKVDHPKLKAALPPIAKSDNGRSGRADAIPADPRESVANESREGSDNGAPASRVDLRPTTFDLQTYDQRASDPRARAHEAAHDDPTANGDGAPPDFDAYQPTDAQRARAAELRVDLEAALRKWRGNRKANGYTPADLTADFDEWLEREPDFSGGRAPLELPRPTAWSQPYREPEPTEPPATPEEAAAGMALIHQAVGAVSMPDAPADPPGSTIRDPDVIAEREANRERQRRALGGRRGAKT